MILFLDIDGVLNSTRSFIALRGKGDRNHIDPVAVGLVNKVLYHCDTLVLSSTHRKFFADRGYGSADHLSNLELYLTDMGIKLPMYFSITDDDINSSHRGAQVHNWIIKYNINNAKYVIIDDSTDFYDHQPLIKTDPDDGFSFKDYRKALQLFGVKDTHVFL